jgi:hypothetical protein
MSFLLLLALTAATAAAWLLHQRLVRVEEELQTLRKAVEARDPSANRSKEDSGTGNAGLIGSESRFGSESGAGTASGFGLGDGAGSGGRTPSHLKGAAYLITKSPTTVSLDEHAASGPPPAAGDAVLPGAELDRDMRILPGNSSLESTGENASAGTTSWHTDGYGGTHDMGADGDARMDAASAPPVDATTVRSLYARWVREQARPEPPQGWEIAPLRFVRAQQEHAAAVPVYLFQDAGQIGDFVRFSRTGDWEAYVLPHPDAAHNPDTITLVFPDVSPAVLNDVRSLTSLEPARMQRSGEYWQAR